jgi:hypothetical protein
MILYVFQYLIGTIILSNFIADSNVTSQTSMKPDKIYLSLTLLLLFTVFSWFTSCTHVADITNLPEVCFDPDVLQIYKINCAISGCHDGTGESGKALDNYTNIRQTVVPYKPDASQSYQAITAKWDNMMPPGQPLTEENRTKIRVWIEQGAQPITCADTTAASFNHAITKLNKGYLRKQ